jgi:tetratricopeptide (TPR) repeat protein
VQDVSRWLEAAGAWRPVAMSGFVALNIEPEDEITEEVDDTREIQLEEALKLYQNALKLHSQGPEYFAKAADAYKELFDSEVFHYPEAVSEFARDADEVTVIDQSVPQLSALPSSNAQASPSSLPQIIYLSFKNYGQFLLERYAHENQPTHDSQPNGNVSNVRDLIAVCSKALKQFAEALERDDTDLELWRKAARVAELRASERIVRFCLESVLAGDDEGGTEVVEIPGLDEALAAGQLKEVLLSLEDDLSVTQNGGNEPREELLERLKKRVDPYHFLTISIDGSTTVKRKRKLTFHQPQRRVLLSNSRSWLGVGQALLHILSDEHQSLNDAGPGASVQIDLPHEPTPAEPAPEHEEPVWVPRPDPSKVAAAVKSQEDTAVCDGLMEFPEEDDIPSAQKEVARPSGEGPLLHGLPANVATPSVAGGALIGTAKFCDGDEEETENREAALLSRKRSSGSAGHDENPENGRSKSKRLRKRESNAETMLQEEDMARSLARYYEDQLKDLAYVDEELFRVAGNLLSVLGVEDLGSFEALRQDLARSSDEAPDQEISADATTMNDLRSALMSWSEDKAHSVLYGLGGSAFGGGKAGLTLFLEHSKTAIPKQEGMRSFPEREGLSQFVHRCNDGWYTSHQVALDWLERMIRPNVVDSEREGGAELEPSSYTSTLWPEALKLTVVQLIVREDDYLYQVMDRRFSELSNRLLSLDLDHGSVYTLQDAATAETVQTLYELHLDIYSRITNPSSQVDRSTRSQQQDRLYRWSSLAGSFVNTYADHADHVLVKGWHVVRFIWTAATHANMTEDISQEHVMLCLQDLQRLLNLAGRPAITLPNNAAIPEISVSAVEQERSRISTLDFFMSVFNDDASDPVGVIESLEPILVPPNRQLINDSPEGGQSSPLMPAQIQQLVQFLESGDASLKLFLWRRLRDAYLAIDYMPKVVSCYLGSIEAIVNELTSGRHVRLSRQNRETSLLKWIKELDDLVSKVLTKILTDPQNFDTVDEEHLRNSMSAMARLSRVLHSFALFEDAVRVGQLPELKAKNASGTKTLDKFRDKLRDMHVRGWTLQYALLKEGFVQNKEKFDSPGDDQARYLQRLHNVLGLRGYCKHSNKIFLKLLKSELMTLKTKEDYGAEMAQVLYDLHELKFAPGVGDMNHDCPPELLDKKSAAHILEAVVSQARKMNIKDLLRSELKNTIDKVQQALGAPKSVSVLSYNRRTINAYLKSPISQMRLFRASRGEGDLPIREIDTEGARIAAHGWYFLLGHLALAKFKSVKRTSPGPTDDLDVAASFFRQDLEYGIEKWETWFRLAQVYDAKIEEDLLWSAEKLNNYRSELATLQRNTMHCYEMAMAISVRASDDSPETTSVISEMYTGFAIRLYASSREPLSMDAFETTFHQRHFSSSNEQSNLYQGPSTPSMPTFSVWRFAAHLLRRALIHKPKNWINHYMLGKCLWKMLTKSDPNGRRRVDVEEVLDAFTEAIESLPERKDSRVEQILEPHFKLVSVVHKLVHQKRITPIQGSEALQATPWARNVHLGEDEDSWEPYLLEILRKVGHADKSNWHHRMIARAAHVIYDDQQNMAAALGAKHEFTQQIFTKTMALQVWKPEYERAGRHFVYTSRYVLFFVTLLSQLNDKNNMDQLVRRIRRRPGDYLNHQHVWEEVVSTYVALLRRAAKVPTGYEEAIFRPMDHDVFTNNAEKLENYAHDPDTSNPVLDIIRDAVELKKLNNSLMKGTLIDDLIVDCYASLYQTFVATLPPEDLLQKVVTEKQLIQPDANPEDENRQRMKLGSILTSQTDGNPEALNAGQESKLQGPELSAQPARPPRPKTVTRREVQRKAEGLIVKPPPIKTPTLLKHTAFPRPSVAVAVPVPSSNHARSNSAASAQPAVGLGLGHFEGSRVAHLREYAAVGVESAESSRPGSVHDSADDESELSELEEVENPEDDGQEEEEEEQGELGTTTQSKPCFQDLSAKCTKMRMMDPVW